MVRSICGKPFPRRRKVGKTGAQDNLQELRRFRMGRGGNERCGAQAFCAGNAALRCLGSKRSYNWGKDCGRLVIIDFTYIKQGVRDTKSYEVSLSALVNTRGDNPLLLKRFSALLLPDTVLPRSSTTIGLARRPSSSPALDISTTL
jgi:hypothetical protein